MKYINDVELNSLKKTFDKQGFVKIVNLFSRDFVSYIRNKVDESITIPIDKYQTGFNRIAFDLFVDDEVVIGLMRDNNFRSLLSHVTSEKLFFTQALAFELIKNKSTGFPWHIGTQSFGYQQAADFGCTIWMPLVEIDINNQRGGMAYVPEDIISGKCMYEKIDPSIADYIKERELSGDNPKLNDYLTLRDGVLNDNSMKTLLNHFSIEDNFSLGDVLLFNKNVIHTSIKLYDGDIENRLAFAMRFISQSSTYDLKRALSLDLPRKLFDYEGCTTFHLDVCREDGEVISESNYFNDSDHRKLNSIS